MNIRLAPTAAGCPDRAYHYLSTYRVNETIAIDAGSLGFTGSPAEQARVQHIFLTHCHMDHIASLPIFLENVFELGAPPVTLHAAAEVIDTLQRDIFNGRVWPDFLSMSLKGQPLLHVDVLAPGKTIACEGLKITAVPVNHAVPATGFILQDDGAAVVFPGDTGPTEEIWSRANQLPNLQAVFLEATFPDSQTRLAELARHLMPATFAREVRKIKAPARVIAVHIKARFWAQVVAELKALDLPRVEIVEVDKTYSF